MDLSPFLALVIAVTDGDTIKVITDDKREVKIRLAEIDAPEKKQPFGQASKKALSDLCFETRAIVTPVTTDRYGRTVAHVECRGQDANRTQVATGMAWVYDKYVVDVSLYDIQSKAKADERGLWSDSSAVPPWEWRRK